MHASKFLNFRGPRGVLARTSRSRGVIESIPRGSRSEKKVGTSRIEGRGIPRAIPSLSHKATGKDSFWILGGSWFYLKIYGNHFTMILSKLSDFLTYKLHNFIYLI